MISARSLTKRYGTHVALENVSLELSKGETLVITGRNGSGKTTLLRILGGLARPTSGEILIDGHSPRSMRSMLGYIGHDPYLYPHLTVLENIRFFAQLYRVPASHGEALLGRVEIDHRSNSLVSTLSRGETQRASIARALLHDPDLILADEPHAGLDENTTGLIPSLLSRPGRSLVVTTHDPRIVESMGGSRLDLSDGRAVR